MKGKNEVEVLKKGRGRAREKRNWGERKKMKKKSEKDIMNK